MSNQSEPQDDPAYQKMVKELAEKCTCQPDNMRPCDGLLAGGLCDDINWSKGLETHGDIFPEESDEEYEPLREGDEIKEGDEFRQARQGEWLPVPPNFVGLKYDKYSRPMRRPSGDRKG